MITAWIALEDADPENGCLQYIDGSHHNGILDHQPVVGEKYNLTPDASEIDLSKESFARVRQGGVVFHHGACLHKSGGNASNRWRRAYASHWVSAGVTAESDVLENAYFNDKSYA